MAKRRLGELLLHRKAVSPHDLEQVIAQQAKDLRLGEDLLRRHLVDKQELASALAEVIGVSYLDCFSAEVEPTALALVPRQIAERHCALPVKITDKRLVIIMAEPQNLAALDEIRFVAAMNLETHFGFADELKRAIGRHYSVAKSDVDPLADVLSAVNAGTSLTFIETKRRRHKIDPETTVELQSEHTPAVRLVSAIISASVARHASDIHFDQEVDATVVRIRVDGVLHELTRLPSSCRTSVVSRVKILADMDISERRVPQDGSFLARLGNDPLDLRVSTLPTQNGEKIVIRILNASGPSVELCELGMSPNTAAEFEAIIRQPQGLVLVTGPTGSGKSTTLYASLRMMRARRLNITTVEDPIEYVLEGITQVQVNAKAGRTFAGCLRSILRQDPNVILIGEIRDEETAEIALQAAQTGHLVLSTLHTSDSFGSLGRLFDLGLSRFLVTQSTSAIIAQRLVRKLCSCRARVPLASHHRDLVPEIGDCGPWLWEPVGCDQCAGTGYKGRIGVYELLKFTSALRNAIMRSAPEEELRDLARAEGLHTMHDETLALVREGVTSLDEILRVLPAQRDHHHRCGDCNRTLSLSFRYCPHCGKPNGRVQAKESAQLDFGSVPVTK